MSNRKRHKDVEYAVEDCSGQCRYFDTFDAAAGFAVAVGCSGRDVYIDVLVSSESGARFLQGDDGVDEYREDPDASVFERIEIKVNPTGRVA
jgi:hypothetical protein